MLPDYRVRQRDYLLEISRDLTEELDLDLLLTRILRIAIEMLGGTAGFIALNEEQQGWHIAVNQAIPPALLSYVEKWLGSLSLAGDEERIPEINRMLSEISMGMLNGVGILMRVQRNVIGQIYVFRNHPVAFTNNDRTILSSFANQAAIAVRNARLYNQTRNQNLRMAALLDSVADGIMILHPDLSVASVNSALLKLLNAPHERLSGLPYDHVIQWEKPPQGTSMEEAIQKHWSGYNRSQMYLEGDLVRFGGLKPIPVAITYAPLFAEDGSLLNVIASVRDITRFRTAEEMKSSFISVVSHELKTPIALIKGYASTLRRDDAEWDKQTVQESLTVIEEEADHLTHMVEDLLDATRLQAGGLSLKRSETDLPTLTHHLLKRYSKQHPQYKFTADFMQNFPTVIADEDRLRQVLSNLLNNAVRYSDGGEVRVVGRYDTRKVKVCVLDQGQGFDPRDVPSLFTRFYRSDEAAKHTKGAGLGLYLCKAIVEAHGGRIWVDEQYIDGGAICFTLPGTPLLPASHTA